MAEENKSTSYGNIFKTTFLFGFVQVFKAVVSIIVNKIAAIFLGPTGMGLLGIYNSTISLIQTGASLGLNQSAVRDVAEANGTGDISRRDRVITITLKTVLYTGLLGLLATISLSYYISEWTLGDHSHAIIYCLLAIVICLNIINDGRLAIIKGMRLMRYLAVSSIIGSCAGLFISVPLYYFLKIDGIVPALLLSAILALCVSNYYIKKIGYTKIHLSLVDIKKEAMPMVKIGSVLMFVTFLQTIVAFFINSFVRKEGGIEDVGFFSTGQYILSGYFGLIITALTTDYYPRIADVNNDNKELKKELNKQTLVTIVLCSPMIVIFVALMPYLIKILYSEAFTPVVYYVKISIFSTIIMGCSNLLDMVLVVKQNSRILLIFSVIIRVLQIISSFVLYSAYGLVGLGVSNVIVTAMHLVLVSFVAYKHYNIYYSKENMLLFAIEISLTIVALLSMDVENLLHRSIMVIICIFTSILFSFFCMRVYMKIDIFKYMKSKLC